MQPMNPPVASWRGKRVWIVGASSGIGAATARLLLRKGAMLAVSARSAPELERLAAEAKAADSGHVEVLPLDVTHPTAVASAAEHLLSRWGGLDLVLVVAGTYSAMRADALDLAAARQIIDINLNGPFNVLAAVTPALLQQKGGAIGIIGSVAGYSGLPKAVAYGPSKAAVINLCEALYFDLRPHGIGVHLISPGFVATPLTAANDFRMPALIQPDEAAGEIVRGIECGDFDIHFPKRFSRLLKLLRILPYRAYFSIVRRVTAL